MTYDYASRTAWVDDLAEAALPEGYDLCAPHALAFSVPLGWTRTDRRAGNVATAGDDVPVAAPS
jgi:hypothetical protein